jgi:universal stress protein E
VNKFPQHKIGTDFSVARRSAVESALRLEGAWLARLMRQHAVAAFLWDDLIGEPEPAAAEALRRLADEIEGGSGLRCDGAASTGRAAGGSAHVAKNANVDLPVIGAHGVHPVCGLLVGGTAPRLLRISPRAARPVKRRPTSEYRSALAPTELSAPSRTALQTFLNLLPQASVHVAHALELPCDGPAHHFGVEAETLARYRREVRAWLHETVRAFVSEICVGPGGRSLRVAQGHATTCIGRRGDTNGAKLVVIAAHGKSALEATLLGSVSLHTVMAAHCEVLLMRGGAPA